MLHPPYARRDRKQVAPAAQTTTQLCAGLLENLNDSGIGYGLYGVYNFNDLANNWNGANAQNLRMCSIHTDEETPGSVFYLAVYTRPNPVGGTALLPTTDWNTFVSDFNTWSSGTRLLDFNIGTSKGTRWYIGAWGGGPVKQLLVADLGWDDFISKWKELSAADMRLVKVQLFPAGDAFHLTGLFEAGTGGYAFVVDSDKTRFMNYYTQNQGTMELVDFQVYDQAPNRFYVGVWRETTLQHRFIYDLDWATFVDQVGQLESQNFRLKKAVRYTSSIELPTPQWDRFFSTTLAGAAGYVYQVAQNGAVVAQGAAGNARMPTDGTKPWTITTRMNLASVSKSVTAVALLKLLAATGHSVNDPFYPLIESKCPSHGSGVDTVTFANLLTMKSGMVPDGGSLHFPPGQDIWSYLTTYLQKGLVGTPGVTYAYSNTNFTILQAIISLLVQSGGGDGIAPYVQYVTSQVLVPMGIDMADFNPVPDPQGQATLCYGLNDTRSGSYWSQFPCVAAGGWVSSIPSILKFAIGVRNNVVLPAATTASMLLNGYGFYTYNGIYGQYFHHNGELVSGASPLQGLITGLVHLVEGYDAVFFCNGQDVNQSLSGTDLIIGAFEQRG
jgi:CubicO group peptidase (beta-lactamase class C family)